MAKLSLKDFSKGCWSESTAIFQSQRQPWQNSHSSASISYLFLVRETCCHSDHFFLNLLTHPVDSENRSNPHSLRFLRHTGKCFMLNIVTNSVCVLQMMENSRMASTWNAFKCYLLPIILLSTAGDKHLEYHRMHNFKGTISHWWCLPPISSTTTTFHCLNEKNWTYHFGTHMVIYK